MWMPVSRCSSSAMCSATCPTHVPSANRSRNPPGRPSEQECSARPGSNSTSRSLNPGSVFVGQCSREPRSTSSRMAGSYDQKLGPRRIWVWTILRSGPAGGFSAAISRYSRRSRRRCDSGTCMAFGVVSNAGGSSVRDERSKRYPAGREWRMRSEEHTSELQSPVHLVCRLLLEKKKKKNKRSILIKQKKKKRKKK